MTDRPTTRPESPPSPHGGRRRARTRMAGSMLFACLVIGAAACSDDEPSSSTTTSDDDGGTTTSGGATTTTAAGTAPIVFNGQGNNLVAYLGAPPYTRQQLITNAKDDPDGGRDLNAQICFFDHEGETWFIAGEDTNQPDPPAGWGIFRLTGSTVGELDWEQIGKLTPTYQGAGDQPENYGCGLLSDGRVLTVDIGNQALGDGTGQLIIWYPPFDSYEVEYCKLDITIATGQSILVDEDDNIYVASARPPTSGVWKYSPPFPTSPDADGGCGATKDSTGAPMAGGPNKELFIPADKHNATPTGLARTPDGGFYVSSVFNGEINEYDAEGAYVRTILQPPAGETLGEKPFTTGTPLGIGVAADGSLFYADIGVVAKPAPGPGLLTGSVRVIRFDDDGNPLPPETLEDGLAFPDGIGIFQPS